MVLKQWGYGVISSDIVERGYGLDFKKDFFLFQNLPYPCRAIVTNPPYETESARGKMRVEDWVRHAVAMPDLDMLALFLKTTALGGKRRSRILENSGLAWMLQFRGRVTLYRNGLKDEDSHTGMMDFAWYIFKKDYSDYPRIKWIEEVTDGQLELF